jgi:hypothetical protein
MTQPILNARALKSFFDRTGDKRLVGGGGPSMPDAQRDEHVKALIEQHTALRRESAKVAACRRGRALLAELEKSLPADVPLHKRGFGVMDEEAA